MRALVSFVLALTLAIGFVAPGWAHGIVQQLGPASSTSNGYVTTGTQTLAGAKTFSSDGAFTAKLGVGAAPSGAAQLHITHDSTTNDAAKFQDTRTAVARTWVFGPNVGINNTFTFRDSTGSANVLALDNSAGGGNVKAMTGSLIVYTAGKGIKVAEGSNATMGASALVGGTVTVSTTAVTASSRIQVTSNVDGGTPGWLRVSARSAGTSFTITSSSGTDTSTVAWIIIEPS